MYFIWNETMAPSSSRFPWIHWIQLMALKARLACTQREKIQIDGPNSKLTFLTFNNNRDQYVLCSSRCNVYAWRDFVTCIETHRTQVDTVRRKVQQHADKYLLAAIRIVKNYQVFPSAQLHCLKFGIQNPNGAVLCWNRNNGSFACPGNEIVPESGTRLAPLSASGCTLNILTLICSSVMIKYCLRARSFLNYLPGFTSWNFWKKNYVVCYLDELFCVLCWSNLWLVL